MLFLLSILSGKSTFRSVLVHEIRPRIVKKAMVLSKVSLIDKNI